MRPSFRGGRGIADMAFNAIQDKPVAKSPCCGTIFTALDFHYAKGCKCGKCGYFTAHHASLPDWQLEK